MKTNYIMLKSLFELKSKGELLILNDKQYEIVDCNLFYLLLPEYSNYEYNLHFKKTSLNQKNIQLVFNILDKLSTPYTRILIYSNNAKLIHQFFKKTFPDCVFEDVYHKEQTHPDIVYFLMDETNVYYSNKRQRSSYIKSSFPFIICYKNNEVYHFNSYSRINKGVYPLNDLDIKTLFENEVTVHEYFIGCLLWEIKKIDNLIYEVLVNNINSTFVRSLKDIDESTDPKEIVGLIRSLEPEIYLNIKYEHLKFIYE